MITFLVVLFCIILACIVAAAVGIFVYALPVLLAIGLIWLGVNIFEALL